MKKLLAVLVVATVVPSLTGCGCCRRVRDLFCRGAYCGAAAAPLAAPLAPPPVMAAPPVAYDPGCGYGGGIVDASCAYDPGMQTYGYNGGDWQGGGGYELPSYGGSYDGGYIDSGSSTIDPGPAPAN